MGIKSIVKKVGSKIGNKVAQLSELSMIQVEEVQNARDNYLMEMPNPNDYAAIEMTERILSAIGIEIYNAYLPQIKELYLPINSDAEYDRPFDPKHNIRYINITKWVTDTKENSLEKLVNVYAVLSNEECNIALIFNRTKNQTNVYLAVVNTRNETDNVNVNLYRDRLVEAVKGNFPGATWAKEEGIGIVPCLDNDNLFSVATASNIPTEKSEKFISQTIEKLLDGVVPDTNAKEYTIVLLATPVKDVEERKLRLGSMYSGLAPYASWQTDFHFTDHNSFGSSATMGVNVGASAGIQNGRNQSVTDSDSTTDSNSKTDTSSESQTDTSGTSETESESSAHTDGTNESTTDTVGEGGSSSQTNQTTQGTNESRGTNSSYTQGTTETDSINASVGVNVSSTTTVEAHAGTPFAGVSASESVTVGGSFEVGTGHSSAVNNSSTSGSSYTSGTSNSVSTGTTEATNWLKNKALSVGKSAADTLTHGKASAISNSISKMTGSSVANTLGKAVTKAKSATSGIAKNTSLGLNFGASFARSSTVTATVGKSEGITQTFTNYNIKHALELLENQMKRFEQSTALGMWDFAAYVLSEDQSVANNVAHTYLALTQGEESYMSKSAFNTWRGDAENERETTSVIATYVKQLRHPLMCLNPYLLEGEHSFIEYPPVVTPTTCLSGKELAYSLNFPQKSVAGLPILECAEFGRNIVKYDLYDDNDRSFKLGNVFHMNHIEKNTVDLSLESLKSHTFITGSTGSGKSNTVYHILEKVKEAGSHFMVIEPAKGEYKRIFNEKDDVTVYGTNPYLCRLLRINPFGFPDKIHVLEHLDRLVEIFNVCWPMYAAMPAVLKSAIEKSYKDCGWDLVSSKNKYSDKIFPNFEDVARNIKGIIESSEYDSENKGAYKGSLLTRLQALTTGINGLLFSTDDIPDNLLFDEDVIIDLSRVGSSETKSLIMGILVMKLQEHRMSQNIPMNSKLRHITVLEEAHNILRRTSTTQSQEGANLLGKSVEMLANSIAEMRTYGEGFIIADQAPGLMDMSVIRNTNTKIIMKLPDQSDRELVGKAANLNDDQIKEVAKLPCGVAAIYQNEWIQPVLCKIDRFESDETEYPFDPSINDMIINNDKDVSGSLLKQIMDSELFRRGDKTDLIELKDIVIKSRLQSVVKVDLIEYINSGVDDGLQALGCLIYDLLQAEEAVHLSEKYSDIHEWVDALLDELKPTVKGYSKKQIDLTVMLILQEQSLRDATYHAVLNKYIEEYRKGGGVF